MNGATVVLGHFLGNAARQYSSKSVSASHAGDEQSFVPAPTLD